ncbi:myc proto-oncogene protein-like [Octopus vulgaris]|uniref:Myc proto-oncogene protein-like n=1 Tax=Octopus vulgaris TaxID=6645 RepID=A0AA36C0B5_OCTVU|nr:myc proto-oncogene protein-like [Octopus vulgaris]
MELIKDVFELSPCKIANTDDYLYCYDPISILSQDPIIWSEENLPKFMWKPAEWPEIEIPDWGKNRITCEDTVPDDNFPSKCPELLSQDELWSPRASPLSSPKSSGSPSMSPSRFSHDEESMNFASFVVANSYGHVEAMDAEIQGDDDDEDDDGEVNVCSSPAVSRNVVEDHPYHQTEEKQSGGGAGAAGGRRRQRQTASVSKKAVRNRKRKGKPGRPRKTANVKGKKVNEKERLISPKMIKKRKARQTGILRRATKVTPAILVEVSTSNSPLTPPITPPSPQSLSSSSSSFSLISSSPSPSSDNTSSVAVAATTFGSSGTKNSRSADERLLSEKTKRRKCMSHSEKAVHNELERRRRAQMSELLSELRVVIDAVKDDPKASQKRIVDEALLCIERALREEKEMKARMEVVKKENDFLKSKLRELSSEWHDLHGNSKVVIYRDTDEDEECSVVEIM